MATVTNVDVHVAAELGAVGMVVLFPFKLLHPSPSQILQ